MILKLPFLLVGAYARLWVQVPRLALLLTIVMLSACGLFLDYAGIDFNFFSEVAQASAFSDGVTGGISPNYPRNVRKWEKLIVKHARINGLDPDLVAAVITIESGGRPTVISHSGAVGLMQIMASDGLSAKLYGNMFKDRPTVRALKDPETNIAYGTMFLANLIKKYGEREGLKKYGPMDRGFQYADKVLHLYYQNDQ